MALLVLLFFALSVLGLLASIALHVASFLPGMIPGEALALIPGVFVVWLPAAIASKRRARGRGFRAQLGLDAVPAWWGNAILALAGMGLLSTLISCVIDWAGGPKEAGPFLIGDIETPSLHLRFFTGVTMIFYALAALELHPSRVLEKDPADAWPEAGVRGLVLAFDDGSLNGVRLGQPAERLRIFGRPDNRRPSRSGRYIFRRLGLVVETEKGSVDYLAFVVEDLERLGLEPCRVTLELAGGARLHLGPGAVQREIVAALGEPEERDEDAEERIHVYRGKGIRREIEYALDGRLRRLNVFRG
jgi:hypothetical protein